MASISSLSNDSLRPLNSDRTPLLQVRRHEFPEFILVQPNGIGISSDKFLDRQTIDQLRTAKR